MGHFSYRAGAAFLLAGTLVATGCSRESNPEAIERDFAPVLDDALHLEPPAPTVAPDPTIAIVNPADSEIVRSPIQFTIDAVAPQTANGDTEVHVFVDEPCSAAGASVVVDGHRFALNAQVDTIAIEVNPGFHTFCAQAIDAASGRSTSATAEVALAVVPPEALPNS